MPHADFVHLRVHSAYSLSKASASKIWSNNVGLHTRRGSRRHQQYFRRHGIFDAAASAGSPIIGCALSVNMEAKEPAQKLPSSSSWRETTRAVTRF